MEAVKGGPLPEEMVTAFERAWQTAKEDSPAYFTLYKGKGSVGGENK
jgi:aflatoxin B1 aldehyde reductase